MKLRFLTALAVAAIPVAIVLVPLPAVPRVLTLVLLARGCVEVACKKTHLYLSAFPLFVPSLSW
jgi:hypothetical protein